jgi:hypothetical protein
MRELAGVPAVGQLVRRTGGEIPYRVVSATARGCSVEATVTEAVKVTGRQPRRLHYSERRASLALSEVNGRKVLIDGRWNTWEVIG